MIHSLRCLNLHTTIFIVKKMWSNKTIVFLFKIFICLAVLGLSCSIWDLVPWPGIKLKFPALEVQSLKATGSSAKFCSLVFVYYSEFLVWVRKISPSFHNLAIYFKYFFSMNFVNLNWKDSVWNFIKFTYECHPVR